VPAGASAEVERVRRGLPVIAVFAVVTACAGPGSSGEPPTDLSSGLPVQTGGSGPSATPSVTVEPTTGPRVLPGLVDAIDIEGTVVLGKAADGTTVLYDLANETTVTVEVDPDARPMDLSERVAVGIRGDGSGAFLYDRTDRIVSDLGGHVASLAADGNLVAVATWTDGLRDVVSIRNLDTGKVVVLHFLDRKGRPGIAAISGQRIVGVYGQEFDEHAWLYDMNTGAETDIQQLLDENVSWASDVDGPLVVGGLETRRPFLEHAFVYDAEAGIVMDLGEVLGGQSRALAIDGTRIVGWVGADGQATAAFVYDRANGTFRILPAAGDARATAINGNLVVGVEGGLAVVWDLQAIE
jgi:hypothetical protein